MDTLVLKVGGNELDDPAFLDGLAGAIGWLGADHRVVLVHGGGKEIAAWQEKLGLTPRFIEGLRVTDDQSMAVAEMVLSARTNKMLVARLLRAGILAAGISGVDGGLLIVEKMTHPAGDLGRVGRIVGSDPLILRALLAGGFVPVVSPISLGRDGRSYNVNADQAAQAVAVALGASALVFVSNVPGVKANGQVVESLTVAQAEGWIADGTISGGMIPKVRAALSAVGAGVRRAVITNLAGLRENSGTAVV
ncbi:MAG: acetylglutamate kinase [Anaerolineae bacterium]|nr:acetylglutamate kinase [Anaerolineae bacterium]